jgi:hypothetical protein
MLRRASDLANTCGRRTEALAAVKGPEFFYYLSECWSQKGPLLPVVNVPYFVSEHAVCVLHMSPPLRELPIK